MPAVPLSSPATGNTPCDSFIHTTACNFVDNAGRTLLLRGVNLSGCSKAPFGRPSYILEDFWESAEAGTDSFIGQPLNLDDGSADVHLARLRGWGFNLLRFPVVWEALEHEGPGKYDFEFMDYVVAVLQKCKEYGFRIFMDPHQDVWSRFSGGSGAPFWTLAACGINPRNLTATQSSIIHCEYPVADAPNPASQPAMMWSTNYGRLLSQIIFTLFFAGRTYAPRCIIDGKNIQDYLQEHFITAMGHLADRIRDVEGGGLLDECVIGWDSMNEPSEGLCGWPDLHTNPAKQGSILKMGSCPTPAQSFCLGMGQAQTVEAWSFGQFGPSRSAMVTIDPKGASIWASPDMESPDGVHPRWGWKRDVSWKLGTCVWALHGVWDPDGGVVLKPDYFRYSPETGALVDPISDFWRPHFVAFTGRIRASHPEAIMFVQPPVFAQPPELDNASVLKGRCAYSGHYYDGLTLVTRHWSWFNVDILGLMRGKYSNRVQAVRIGESAIRRSLQDQLGILKADAEILGDYPTVIGEIGTPFDMDGKRSYGWTDNGKYKGDYGRQERALDASLNGGDGVNAINWTMWTYCPTSTHEWGDGWNMEDLSIWSPDDLRGQEQQEVLLNTQRDGSRAMLLRGQKKGRGTDFVSVAASAAASSFSLATLGSITAPSITSPFDQMSIRRLPYLRRSPQLTDWLDDPYDFLTDGARAVRAFSRPYPQKVVGVPSDIKFDIGKASFKLVVCVGHEDRPYDNDLATEIFVPLVHFAREKLVRRSEGEFGGEDEKMFEGGRKIRGSVEDQKHRLKSKSGSSVNLALPMLSRLVDKSNSSTLSSGQSTPKSGFRMREDRDLVDVDVKVSAGKWEVSGQVLKWWYDVPVEGEEKREYTIEITRRGGVVKTAAMNKVEEGQNLCERMCDQAGCTIM